MLIETYAMNLQTKCHMRYQRRLRACSHFSLW